MAEARAKCPRPYCPGTGAVGSGRFGMTQCDTCGAEFAGGVPAEAIHEEATAAEHAEEAAKRAAAAAAPTEPPTEG
jgi:ribosomal protein L37AE/L43A